MTSLTLAPRPAAPNPTPPARRRLRERIARLERPLLLAGLALVTAHLLDLALSGPDTSLLGVLVILALPVAYTRAQPHLTRPTRLGLGVVVGLVAVGFGVVSHGLHVVNSGPDWRDVTGVGYILGGLLLVVAGVAATAAPRRAPRRPGLGWRAAHGLGWLAGVPVVAIVLAMGFAYPNLSTHAPRWEIHESALAIPHEEIRITMDDGRKLSAWYVPSRNGAAVLVSHGSGGSRGRLPRHVRMLARHGYGVLALDNPGNGESQGHSNGLGDNAQPALDAGLDYLDPAPRRRPRQDRGLRPVARRRGPARGRVARPAPGRRRQRRRRPPDGRQRGDATRALLTRAVVGLSMQSLRVGLRHGAVTLAGRDDAPDRAAPGPPGRRRRRHRGAPRRSPVPAQGRQQRERVGGPGRRAHRRAAQAPRRL